MLHWRMFKIQRYILKYVKIDLKSNNNNKNIGNTLLKTFMYNVL